MAAVYWVREPLSHDGVDYAVGSRVVLALTEEQQARLIADGVLEVDTTAGTTVRGRKPKPEAPGE